MYSNLTIKTREFSEAYRDSHKHLRWGALQQ